MSKIYPVLVVLLVACKGGGGGGAEAVEVKRLGESGFAVDAPKSWELKEQMKGFYELKAKGRGFVMITESPMTPPASLDELVKSRCEGQSELVKETLPGGGFFVQCKGPGQQVDAKFTTTKVESVVLGGEGFFKCAIESDSDVAVQAAICRSLRKQ